MIINRTKNLYGSEGAGETGVFPPCELSLVVAGELARTVKTKVVRSPLALSLSASGFLSGGRRKATSINLNLKANGEMSGAVRLALSIPAPILNEVSENAFADQCYAARLLGDGVEIKISSAVVEKPKNEIGLRVTANVSQKQLAVLALDKQYTFQIGVSPSPVVPLTWHTILENAALDSRTFSRAFSNKAPNDSLSIGLFAPVTNKLNRGPKKNIILYDPNKTEMSLEGIEPVYDNHGDRIETELVPRSGLNLKAILARLRIESGFAGIETNIPNYEISRAEFGIANTFNQSVAPFVGDLQPLVFAVGNTLWILDKTAEIPAEFVPRAIVASNLENLSVSIPAGGVPDGFELSFVESDNNFNYYTQRLEYTDEDSGVFGSDTSAQTKVTRDYRDYRNTENPAVVVKSELKKETREIRRGGFMIYRSVTDYNYSSLNRLVGSTKEVHQLLPDFAHPVPGTGEILYAWMKSRDERVTVQYAQHPFNPRQSYQSRTVTEIRGMQAVDSENPYAGQEFIQDFIEAHKAGNLKEGMNITYGAIKTITERATPKRGGQVDVEIETVDHVRNMVSRAEGEPRTGDVGLGGYAAKNRKKIIWREGLTRGNRPGVPLEPFSGGEVPLAFLEPLCQRILDRRAKGKHEGNITVIGFDPSIDGAFSFSLYDRDESFFGRYIAAGLRVNLENLGVAGEQKVTTVIDCEEI